MDTTHTGADSSTKERDQRVNDVVARILARSGTALASTTGQDTSQDAGALEREARAGTRRVDTGASDREDISEVEYRQVRLEKVVLVGLRTTQSEEEAENSLRELAALAETAGSRVLDGIIQRRMKPDPATYLGSGKARELADIVRSVEADTVIVDEELAPSQRRGLEDVVDAKVVDRTALILDIFAQHAKSREGKAQVELAQLEYMLPRLRGWGGSLSRQAGGRAAGADAGIGSRGPGGTKNQMGCPVVPRPIPQLRRQIAEMAPAREVKRGSRRRFGLPTVAVVGYTNAGKSSLTNRLTGSAELVENALFATLDTAVRRARAKDGRLYAYVDTVGFVRRLPTQLIEAFKSTLEEVAEADLIVHVVDGSHPDPFSQIDAVNDVLADIDGVGAIPTIVAFNKSDLMGEAVRERIEALMPDAYVVSAYSGEGVDELRTGIESMLPTPNVHVEALLPYSAGSLVSRVREYGKVLAVEYRDDGMMLRAEVDDHLAARIVEQAIA